MTSGVRAIKAQAIVRGARHRLWRSNLSIWIWKIGADCEEFCSNFGGLPQLSNPGNRTRRRGECRDEIKTPEIGAEFRRSTLPTCPEKKRTCPLVQHWKPAIWRLNRWTHGTYVPLPATRARPSVLEKESYLGLLRHTMKPDPKLAAGRAFVRSLNILLKFARLYGYHHSRTTEQLGIASLNCARQFRKVATQVCF